MPSTSTLRGRDLATLTGAGEWQTWKTKAKAFFMRKGMDSTFEEDRPTQRLTVPATDEWKRVWLATRRAAQAAQRALPDENLNPNPLPPAPAPGQPEDVGEPPAVMQEQNAQLLERQTQWDTNNKAIWAYIIEACHGEALTVAQQADYGDGRGVYKALTARYGSATVNSRFLAIKALVLYKQCLPIAEHVTEWRKRVSELASMGHTIDTGMEAVMFLMSLESKFQPYTSNAMMNMEKLNIQQLFMGAIEFDKSTFENDEAKSKSVAMECTEQCRHGAGCRDWRNGRCNKFHPAPARTQREQAKNKRKFALETRPDGKTGWTCSCGFYNYGTRSHCRECENPRGSGSSTSSRPNKYSKGKGKGKGKSKSTYRARYAALEDENKKLKDRAAQMGLDLGLESDRSGDSDSDSDSANVAIELAPDTAMAVHEPKTKKMKFTIDSGASAHFVTAHVPLMNTKSSSSVVRTAGGRDYKITEKGTCSGVTTRGEGLSFTAKKCEAFKQNLFSVLQAAKAGTRTVFDWDDSYLEVKSTGERIPLTRNAHGWELTLQHGH